MNPLHEVFEYRDGGLYWKQPGKNRIVGKRCGTFNHGYRQVYWNRKLCREHRLIWEYFYGIPPTNFIDHIDGNKSNNLINNLREATRKENGANRGKNKNNTTGYKGVSWNTKRKTYIIDVMKEGKQIRRYAKDLEEACRWANELRNQLHGEFAKHA